MQLAYYFNILLDILLLHITLWVLSFCHYLWHLFPFPKYNYLPRLDFYPTIAIGTNHQASSWAKLNYFLHLKPKSMPGIRSLGLHMGPNNFCYVTRHFLFFSICRHVTFYKTLPGSLSTVFIKAHVRLLQLLKWPCRTSFFTHVETGCFVFCHNMYNVASSPFL